MRTRVERDESGHPKAVVGTVSVEELRQRKASLQAEILRVNRLIALAERAGEVELAVAV